MDAMEIIELGFDQQVELAHLDDVALHAQYLLPRVGGVADED